MRICSITITMLLVCASTTSGAELDALRDGPTCANWGAYSALRSSGTFGSDGLLFHFSNAVDTRVGRSVLRYAGGSNEPPGSRGFDGTTSWLQDDSGASHAVDTPHERMLARSEAWIARRGWCAHDFAGAHALSDGARIENGRVFDVLRVTPPQALPFVLWIDRATQLVDRTIVQLAESREVDRYSDWRTVAGLALPFCERIEYPEDESVETLATRFVGPSRKLAAATFAEPPAPTDVTMLHGAASTTVPYRVEAQKPLVDVWLDGKGPFPFVLDTGGHFILTAQTARSLGVRGFGAANSLGQGTGVLKTSFARIATLRIGGAVVRNQIAEIIPYRYSRVQRAPHPPKAGWLGLQFFERFRTTMNPLTRRLTLAPLGAGRVRRREPGIRIPLLFEEDTPVVACLVEGHPGTCMIDTGNAGPTIVEGHWLERAGLGGRLKSGLDDDGERLGRARIDFGPISLRRELVDFSPPAVRGSESTQAVAAILSQDVIDRYVATFDYGERTMTLQPLGIPPAAFNRTGLGLEKRRDGSFNVSFVIADSPAARAGFRIDDRIEAVDEVDASKISSADFYKLSRGPLGAVHRFRVARGGMRRTTSLRLRDLL